MKVETPQLPKVSVQDLANHNTKDDCWIAIHSQVWDVTDFVHQHPGGPDVLLDNAGSDATEVYDEVHAPDVIVQELSRSKLMGHLDQLDAVTPEAKQQHAPKVDQPTSTVAAPVEAPSAAKPSIPPLESLISAQDFVQAASKALSPKTWAFYSSAATDLVTHQQNKALVRRIMIRPRILRNVLNVDIRRNILGLPTAAPFFIAPAAMARLAHPDGEIALSRAAAKEGIIQCISTNASYSLRSIVNAAPPSHPFFFQLYVNSERQKTLEILKTARELGIKAIFVTVDAPVPGKREADERAAQEGVVKSAISGGESSRDKKGSGFGRLMGQYIDKSLCWDDLAWIREAAGDMSIVLKGVQTADDVRKAVEYGIDGVLLSNHGGRSLDGAQASILILLELRKQSPELFDKLEIYIDGGFERGSDILKAIALGATAVGIGRSFLYSLIYGQEGAEHLCHILKDELETSMRLCGITNWDEALPRMVNTRDIDYLVDPGEETAETRLRQFPSKL